MKSSGITQEERPLVLSSPCPGPVTASKVVSWIRTTIYQVQPRVWLYFYGLLFGLVAFAMSGLGMYFDSTSYRLIGTFLWILWFALMFAMCVPSADRIIARGIRWFRGGALAVMVLFMLLGLGELIVLKPFPLQLIGRSVSDSSIVQPLVNFVSTLRFNDGLALTQQATENIVTGKNPYENANVITAFQRFGQGAGDQVTPLQVGVLSDSFPYPTSEQLDRLWQQASTTPEKVPPEFESKFNYPAGAFLLPAPFFLLGVQDLRVAYTFYVLTSLAGVIWLLRRRNWLVFVFGILAGLQFWNALVRGEIGMLWFAPFLLAWVLLLEKHWWLSAVAIGLAVIAKQTAWFFVPFYLIFVFRSIGLKPLLKMGSVVGGIFLAANLPFIVAGPRLWVASVFAPMMDSMFPTGSGIISFVLSGLVDIRSPLVFTVIEAVVFIGGTIWYYFNCRKYPWSALVLGIFPLFFAWRSIQSHFLLVDIVLLSLLLLEVSPTHSAHGELHAPRVPNGSSP